MTSAVRKRLGPFRAEIANALELFAVSGLAFAQPMFDLLGKNPDLFMSRGIDTSRLVLYTIGVLLVPPMVMYLVEVVGGIVSPAARPILHALLIGLGGGIFVSEAVKHTSSLGSPWLLILGIAAGVLTLSLRLHFLAVRTWLRLLAVAPVIFAFLFLFASPVSDVVVRATTPRAAAVKVGSPHRVVWVVLDELPETSLLDGHGAVDSELFPNFAKLAATSTWYRNSTTIAPFTLAAVPGMLTSSYPHATNGVAAVASNYPNNAFTLLGGTYRVNAVEAFTVLCPAGICDDLRHVGTFHGGLAGLVEDSIDLWNRFASPEKNVTTPDLTRGALPSDPYPMGTTQRFLLALQPPLGAPQFDFLHVLLPHWPWTYVKSLQNTGENRAKHGLRPKGFSSAWAARSARERHLLQVQATDTVLGLVRTRLEALGQWDDSLVVVTADHGVGFVPGQPRRGLSKTNYWDVAWTPLFFKYPGQQQGVTDDRPARTVDVLPTIADVLQVEIPWKVAGRSLLGTPRDDGKLKVLGWKLDGNIEHEGRFNIIDGPTGFQRVLRSRAAGPGPDPALRIYRTGPYGGLVGRKVTEIPTSGRGGMKAVIRNRSEFATVVPTTPFAPWLSISGTRRPARAGVPLAIAVNGVVGATVETVAGSTTTETWWATLPPHLFRTGANDVTVYRIEGTPVAPRLQEIAST